MQKEQSEQEFDSPNNQSRRLSINFGNSDFHYKMHN